MKDYVVVNIPPQSKICVWKKTNNYYSIIKITINNKNYILSITDETNKKLYFDKWSNSIVINKTNLNVEKTKINKFISNFLKSLNLYYFSKIKFKGKGFRIKFLKKNKIIKFYFGKSHMTFIFLKKILKKRINKYKFIIKSINLFKLKQISKKITNIKKFNVYTLRGIRLSKQIIFKRKGKKGTYI